METVLTRPCNPPLLKTPYRKTNPAPAAASPNISMPTAAVRIGAFAPAVEGVVVAAVAAAPPVVPLVVVAAVAALSVPVVAADAVPVVAAAVPVALAAESHVTTVGTATPLAWQIWVAKVMASAWSAASQAVLRQQAVLERKESFEQMHFGSVPQLP